MCNRSKVDGFEPVQLLLLFVLSNLTDVGDQYQGRLGLILVLNHPYLHFYYFLIADYLVSDSFVLA